MHGRKRPFTEKNGDIRGSYTGSVHGHRIRIETVKNGFRIRRSCKNTEWFESFLLRIRSYTIAVYGRILSFAAVYGRIRLQYASLYGFALKVSEHITISILWNSRIYFEKKTVSVSYNARISGSLSLLLYQPGWKIKSTWMEGVSGKEYVAGFRNSEGISSSGIASIFLVVRGRQITLWCE
jgi:hypothetical protein